MGESSEADPGHLAWPMITAECRPWTRWWWPGSAVADADLERELSRLEEVGIGGVEITPIYGVQGEEHHNLAFLNSPWLERLDHTVTEATGRGMAVDIVPGTGWHFGGPSIGFEESAMTFESAVTRLEAERFEATYDPARLQSLVAYAEDGRTVDLTDEVGDDGRIEWRPEAGSWTVVSILGCAGREVKRAAPDREGLMLSPFHPAAMREYLERFDREFAAYDGPPVRATFHDSFEFDAHWSPLLLETFEDQCGYRLQEHLLALLGETDEDTAARVKADYRRVLSRLYAETITEWMQWNHRRGRQARFQAHCAPGNILDLYALADIPETEFIGDDGHVLASKLASSAGHLTDSRLISAETATWLDEHFTVSLGALKAHIDELFLAGINHIVYHGTAYSPDDAPWPGWLFYASTQLNSRNPIWRDIDALNEYVSRCQAVLQTGEPDADVLVYWPMEDIWHAEPGFAERVPILDRDWFESYSFGRVAGTLQEQGYSFEFVSDRLLEQTHVEAGRIIAGTGEYEAVIVPETTHIPLETMERLLGLVESGATVGFEEGLPADVPGYHELESRRNRLGALCDRITLPERDGLSVARIGDGKFLVGEPESMLAAADVRRESLVEQELQFVRRRFDGGKHYFIVNKGEEPIDGWVPIADSPAAVAGLDPKTGAAAPAAMRHEDEGRAVYLQLAVGESVILRCFEEDVLDEAPRGYYTTGQPVTLNGPWSVTFIRGGPERPPGRELDELQSWTELGELYERFGGTARYETTFDRPPGERWSLDLGTVHSSATVWLNGDRIGTVMDAPYRLSIDDLEEQNTLVVEVTNRGANRIRDLDRRDVDWKCFEDINLVDLEYEPFDASEWDVRPAGLLGPVRLRPREPWLPDRG